MFKAEQWEKMQDLKGNFGAQVFADLIAGPPKKGEEDAREAGELDASDVNG